MENTEISLGAEPREGAQEHEVARHDLTIKAASSLFAELGAPRSPRSVQGFCKEGHIDCVRIKGPSGDRYFVDRKSVQRYAIELKQIEEVGKISADEPFARLREPARERAQLREVTAPTPTEDTDKTHERLSELEGNLKTLREENLNLRIDNKGKESFINQLVQDRNRMIDSVQDVSYKLGVAESRVQQLAAPREDARSSAQDREGARSDMNQQLPRPNRVAPIEEDGEKAMPVMRDEAHEEEKAATDEHHRPSIWTKMFR